MKLQYVGRKEKLVMKRKGLSKPCDFTKGICDVTAADGKLLLTTCPRSFKDITPPPEPKKAK